MSLLRVSASSDRTSTAGALANVIRAEFVDVFIEGKQKTAIRLLVKPRHPLSEGMTVPKGRCHCPSEELRQDESSGEASLLVA